MSTTEDWRDYKEWREDFVKRNGSPPGPKDAWDAALAAQAPQAAEPVGLVDQRNGTTVAWTGGRTAAELPHGTGLYIAPQAPSAQPLTFERVCQSMDEGGWPASMLSAFTEGKLHEFARAIERAHGIGIAPSSQGETE